MPSQSLMPFILLAIDFIILLLTTVNSFSTLATLLSWYPIVYWLVSGIFVSFFVSVTLGLAHGYGVLEAHSDSTPERTRQICWAIVGLQLLGGLIGLVLCNNTPRPRAVFLYLVNGAEE